MLVLDTTHRKRIRTVGAAHRAHPARARVQEAPVLRRGRVRRGRPNIARPPNVSDVAVRPVAIAGCRVECHIARICCLRISGSEKSTSPYLEVSICKAGTFISLIIFIRCNHIISGNIARIISCCNGMSERKKTCRFERTRNLFVLQ